MFYNGTALFPDEKIMRLSDAYLEKQSPNMLELTVKAININLPTNHPILKKCRPLYEYSWFIQRIREYLLAGASRDEAIIQAITDCEEEGIMVEFVREHGTEAVNMLFTEFNMEDALDVRYEEGVEDGIQKGKAIGITEGKAEGIQLTKSIFRLLGQGLSINEIADKLGLSEEEVHRIAE